ncbi:Carbon catabolite repressor protein 4-like [Gracilariopsis chorda]|uniref:Carbon catabolite repressor protein 4-like n=1 Tax=Gracilariopsis chorda TaxID=448386 RepID=A0A2V3J174_9FLOR|nr:Carbon catabolite repressor protein 4-like [Gracilariopsis chorda]|eukprot:PXF48109.1 Carbon catabolite repressor protein 4-like [Gracilariopsis chorda]
MPAASASPTASPPAPSSPQSATPQIQRVEFLYTQTPVEGCDLLPYVVVRTAAGDVKSAEAIEAKTRGALSVQYRWNRCAATYTCARTSCFKPAAQQFVPLLKLASARALPPDHFDAVIKQSFFCSTECMCSSWETLRLYTQKISVSFPASEATNALTPDDSALSVRSHFVPNRTEPVFQEPLLNPTNISEVAFIRNYAPTADDVGHVLELVCRYVQRNSDGTVNIGPPVSVRSRAVRTIPPPPPERRMFNLSTGELYSAKTRRPGTFRVLSYNVLAEIYANSQAYPHCPSWALSWTYRKRNLIREMALFDADVLCLQEIQADHFEDHFQPYFARLGYESCFKVKTREAMGRKGKIDGCATFFRKEKFALREQHIVEYNAIAQARTKEPRTLNRCLKGNVGLILILECLDGSGPLVVANTHLYWDPELTDVKIFQVDAFMHELEVLFHNRGLPAGVPFIMAGDLNSEPVSSVYEFLSTGQCSMTKPDMAEEGFENVLSTCRLSHNLHMRSAYALTGSEPAFTNYTHNFVGVLDYIWFGADSVLPVAILEIPDERSLFGKEAETDSEDGIPNAQWSSDHVALVAEFQLVKRHGLAHGPI